MPDDAIERAAEEIATRVVPGRVNADWQRTLTLHEADSWDAAKRAAMIAFASQQAPPEGWRLVPVEPSRAMLEAACEVPYDDEVTGAVIYTTTLEAKAVWSAMLDAAPSVTLGEVG